MVRNSLSVLWKVTGSCIAVIDRRSNFIPTSVLLWKWLQLFSANLSRWQTLNESFMSFVMKENTWSHTWQQRPFVFSQHPRVWHESCLLVFDGILYPATWLYYIYQYVMYNNRNRSITSSQIVPQKNHRSNQIVPERSCLMRPLLLLMSTGSMSLNQEISGSGLPLAAHSMVAVLVFSTTFSWGPISMVGKPWGIWFSENV